MTAVLLQHPAGLGAVHVQIFDPRGNAASRQVLMTPGSNFRFETAFEGRFLAKITPLGMSSRIWPFDVSTLEGQTVRFEADVEPHNLGPLARPAFGHEQAARFEGNAEGPSIERVVSLRGRQAYTDDDPRPVGKGTAREFGFEAWTPPPAMRKNTIVVPASRRRRISVGLSQDERPNRYGGWRPYSGSLPLQVSHEEDRWTFVIGGKSAYDATEPERLRLEVSIEKQRIQRLLIPTFIGGTKVTLRFSTGDVTIDVVPLDEHKRLVLQTLMTNSPREAALLRAAVSGIGQAKGEQDLFVNIAEGLIEQRFGASEKDLGALVSPPRKARIPDEFILWAVLHHRDGRPGRALQMLSRAQVVGAPYFTYANALLGDLLVELAGTDDFPELTALAQRELDIWRGHTPYQTSVGPFFSWLRSTGYRTRGGLDERYNLALFSTQIDMPDAVSPLRRDRYKNMNASEG